MKMSLAWTGEGSDCNPSPVYRLQNEKGARHHSHDTWHRCP
jgi:hypothetical protein